MLNLKVVDSFLLSTSADGKLAKVGGATRKKDGSREAELEAAIEAIRQES
jgi:hypothetical protein